MTDLLKALHTEQLLSEGLLDRALKAERELDTSLAAYKWTRITDDPDTWPEHNTAILVFTNQRTEEMMDGSQRKLPRIRIAERSRGYSSRNHVVFYGILRAKVTHWRPLTSIDYPPTGDE